MMKNALERQLSANSPDFILFLLAQRSLVLLKQVKQVKPIASSSSS